MNSGKNLQYDFPKMRGGGPKAVWNFSENSSVLVGLSVPKVPRHPWEEQEPEKEQPIYVPQPLLVVDFQAQPLLVVDFQAQPLLVVDFQVGWENQAAAHHQAASASCMTPSQTVARATCDSPLLICNATKTKHNASSDLI